MKKMMMLIALIAVAGIAGASLINGDFTDTTLNTATRIDPTVGTDAGWYQNLKWSLDGSVGKYRGNGGANRRLGQMYSDSLSTGTYTLEFDWTYAAASGLWTDGDMHIVMYGSALAGSGMVLQDGLYLNQGYDTFGNAVGGSANQVELLNDKTVFSGGAGFTDSGHFSVTFEADASYQTYTFGITFGSNALTDGTIDNVTITPVPEPATIGMLGLGSLVALMVRRLRK